MFCRINKLILSFIVCVCFHNSDAVEISKQDIYKEGEIIVKFKSGISKSQLVSQPLTGANIIKKLELKDGTVGVVKLPSGVSVSDAIKIYSSNPNVEYVEPNYKVRKLNTEFIPNDPYFGKQWGLRNIGDKIEGFEAKVGADIKASYSWSVHKGGEIVVAVIDTGVDYNHPDLKDNIWINKGEVCNNGVDDDGNGYIDDCYGWNFAYKNNNPFDDDTDGHGTHVAGVIGAVGDNGIGVAGINWKVKIMPLKFLDKNGEGDIYTVVEAINYAVKMGAKVINASYAYPSGCFYTEPSKLEIEALKNAEKAGVIVVAAAGNYGCDNDKTPIYPASHKLSNIISVTASDMKDNKPYWSNYGLRSVHIAAPGFKIYSTVPYEKYAYLTGTSMAAPFVTGAVAFLLTYKPEYDITKVREILLSSVDTVDAFSQTISSGRLNLFNAINMTNIVPVRPVIFSTKLENNSVIVSFQDNSYMEEGFIVKRGISPESLSQIATYQAMEGAYGIISFEDKAVTPGNIYYYQVCAYISGRFACSNLASFNYTTSSSNQSTNQLPPQTSSSSKSGCNLLGVQTPIIYLLIFPIILLIRRLRDKR